jgi:hypothetical protein
MGRMTGCWSVSRIAARRLFAVVHESGPGTTRKSLRARVKSGYRGTTAVVVPRPSSTNSGALLALAGWPRGWCGLEV